MNVELLNRWGEQFLNFAWPMLWQSGVLVGVIFVLDLALRRKVRAAIRHALWLVVLVKLMLPPSLALPTSPSWWIHSPAPMPVNAPPVSFTVTYGEQTMPEFPLIPAPIVPLKPPALKLAAWTLILSGVVSIGLLAWLLIRWRLINRKVRRAHNAGPLQPILDEAQRLTHSTPAIRLKLTEDTMSPAVCGLFRPVILLPRPLVEKLSAEQLRAVLLHELIHLRRGDVWVNCAQALLQIVYWWHPLLWLANARIRRVREEAVDDAVMLALRDDAEIYAPTLLEVAKFAFRRPLASLGLVGILESRSALRQRIERLMDFNAPKKAGLTVVSILGILAFSAVALPMGQTSMRANALSNAPVVEDNASQPELDTFKIYVPPTENDLKKLLLNTGVKIPPTVVLYEAGGILLARGSSEQLDLIEQVVLRLNGSSPQKSHTNHLAKEAVKNRVANSTATNLEMRVFKVDPRTFAWSLQGIHGLHDNNVVKAVESLFSQLGVDLTAPGRNIAFNDGLGLLFVKATASELDSVERVVQALNQTPPQVHIKARFIKVPLDEAEVILKAGTAVNVGETNTVEIITADKMKPLLRQLESNIGVEQLAEPECVTTSGRQTQMRSTDFMSVVTNFTIQVTSSNATLVPHRAKFEIGPSVDLVPCLLADGHTINLTALPELLEFLGYVKASDMGLATNQFDAKIPQPTVLPHFRARKAVATVNLWDNQTLVLGNLNSAFVGGNGQIETGSNSLREAEKENGTADKELLVFITATIVDRAGNRVHSDNNLPFDPSTIPPQPKNSRAVSGKL